MQIITGLYVSVMIFLFVWFVINAISTYKEHRGLYDGVYKLGNVTIWEVLFFNLRNSNGGLNPPTGWIIFVTAAYAFCWLTYFVFHFIIY